MKNSNTGTEYSSPPSYKAIPFCNEKMAFIGGVSIERDNLIVFYYLSSSKIWPDKRDDL